MSKKKIFTVIGATVAASLCCITPVLAVVAGSSTLASSFSWLAPYHNYLVAFTALVLLYAWYDKLKPSNTLDCACDTKQSFFSGKTFLALVTLFSVIMLSFPLWGDKVFNAAPSAVSCTTGTCESEVSQKKKVKINLNKQSNGSACKTKYDCAKKPFKKVENSSQAAVPVGEQAVKVFNTMLTEKSNPTPYKQVACTGTGLEKLDIAMAEKKKIIEEMPPPVLKKLLDEEEEVILLDVREPTHKNGQIIDAFESHSMTYAKVLFSALKEMQELDAVIIVYSKQGLVSLFAAATLKDLGYKNVYHLKGGLKAWELAGYPTVEEE